MHPVILIAGVVALMFAMVIASIFALDAWNRGRNVMAFIWCGLAVLALMAASRTVDEIERAYLARLGVHSVR